MFKQLAILTALAVGSATVAHADTINGYFSATGSDTFTSSTVTFGGAEVGAFGLSGTQGIGGSFATYLTDGTAINFLSLPGGLPYHTGVNTPPNPPYTAGFVPIFSINGSGGEVFTFDLTSYNAGYIANNTAATSGCNLGSTCLDITGSGVFVGTGPLAGTSGPATFTFSSQYVIGQPTSGITTFSASAQANSPTAVTPEPTSLILLGTGLLGTVGLARRRFLRV